MTVFQSFERLDREQECARIMTAYGADFGSLFALLDRQFRLLHNRAQVLLALVAPCSAAASS
jgi:hypothetical protein